MCQCKTTPGGVIVCDDCAAAQIEALNGVLSSDDQYTGDLPSVLTPGEYQGLQGVIDGWLYSLQSQEGGR